MNHSSTDSDKKQPTEASNEKDTSHDAQVEVVDVAPTEDTASSGGKLKALLGIVIKFMGVKDLFNIRLSLPTNLLDPISNLEYWNYMDSAELFVAIPDPDDPLDRMLNVVRWWFSKDTKWIADKFTKPFNSLLGEQFLCEWEAAGDESLPSMKTSQSLLQEYSIQTQASVAASDDNVSSGSSKKKHKVYCIIEQVSHHPPVSYLYMYCKDKGIIVRGVDHVSAKFTGTVVKAFSGPLNHGLYITLTSRSNEEYNLTHPSAYVNGLYRASPYLTCGDSCIITCKKTGLRAVLDYKEESFFGKAKYVVDGKIYRGDRVVCQLNGSWKGAIYYSKTPSLESTTSIATFATAKTSNSDLLIDVSSIKISEKIVAPIEQQHSWESRKAWSPVIDLMHANKFSDATKVKRQIEDDQRLREKTLKSLGKQYKSVWFGMLDKEAVSDTLVTKDDIIIDSDDLSDECVLGKPFLLKSIEKHLPWENTNFREGLPTIDDQVQLPKKE